LGQFCLDQQNWDSAFANFSEALEKASESKMNPEAADALYGLARVAAAIGQYDDARLRGHECLPLFDSLGEPKASEVREWLEKLP
jgi:uncharacterized protein HemY